MELILAAATSNAEPFGEGASRGDNERFCRFSIMDRVKTAPLEIALSKKVRGIGLSVAYALAIAICRSRERQIGGLFL